MSLGIQRACSTVADTALNSQDVSGAFRPHILTALVGASGAGKVQSVPAEPHWRCSVTPLTSAT